MVSFRCAHVSDTHLGFEAYQARTKKGLNQRGADVVAAFHAAVTQIRAADPPLVIHSGDVFESPSVPVRYLLAARSEFERLAEVRPDGTRRAVVAISGNHDTSRNANEGCQLDLFRSQEGLEVVSFGYKQLRFPAELGYDPVLENVVVHALPHDSLRDADLVATVEPVEGATNILVTHGVAEGDDTFKRMIGREFPVPEDLLVKSWDYVALGHWHTQGPVKVAGDNRFIHYAGSTECVDFSDMRGSDASLSRSWLSVEVNPGKAPTVGSSSFPTRRMLSPAPVDASNLDAEGVASALLSQLKGLDPEGAVVRQRVVSVNRDLWALVDLTAVREAAKVCMHHRVEPTFAKSKTAATDPDSDAPDLGDLETVLVERVSDMVPQEDREAVLELCRALLGSALTTPEPTKDQQADETTGDDTGDAPDTGGEVPASPADDDVSDAAATPDTTEEVAAPVDAGPTPEATVADVASEETPEADVAPDVTLGDDEDLVEEVEVPDALPADEQAALFAQMSAELGMRDLTND